MCGKVYPGSRQTDKEREADFLTFKALGGRGEFVEKSSYKCNLDNNMVYNIFFTILFF